MKIETKFDVDDEVWVITKYNYLWRMDDDNPVDTVISINASYGQLSKKPHITYLLDKVGTRDESLMFPNTPEGKELAEKRIGELNDGK